MVTPLVAMTGSASPDPAWASYGFSDMISKPLNKDAFIQQLQQWSNQDVLAWLSWHELCLNSPCVAGNVRSGP